MDPATLIRSGQQAALAASQAAQRNVEVAMQKPTKSFNVQRSLAMQLRWRIRVNGVILLSYSNHGFSLQDLLLRLTFST